MKHLTLHNIHFQELLRSFEKRKSDEGKSASHIQSVTYHATEFLYLLEQEQITDIKKVQQQHLDDYFEYLQKRKNTRRDGGLSNAYLMKHREAVLRLLEFVSDTEVGHTNFYIQKFKKNRIPKDILSPEEVALLFQQNEPSLNGIRNQAILAMLYGCGLRKGELHHLNIGDIDFSKDVVRIQKSKTSYQRDVPISPSVKRYLEEYLYTVRQYLVAENIEEQAFLVNNNGRRLSLPGIQNKIATIAKQSKINKPITCHRLRHAIATHLLGDFSIEEIALFLGHRSLDSSQIYTHLKYTKQPL